MTGDFGQMKCWPSEDVIVKAVEGMIILSALNTRLISVTDPLLSSAELQCWRVVRGLSSSDGTSSEIVFIK